MKQFSVLFLLAAGFVSSPINAAVTDEDFKAATTANLINLCTASRNDPKYREAIHFCHGYLVGAFHYNRVSDPGFLCIPKPYPSRNESIDRFITWTKQHPEFDKELPVETEFRFLSEIWSCKTAAQQ